MHVSVEDVDEPPEFLMPFYYVEVPEDVEIGTIFTSVSARDPDRAIRYIAECMLSDGNNYSNSTVTQGNVIEQAITLRPVNQNVIAAVITAQA